MARWDVLPILFLFYLFHCYTSQVSHKKYSAEMNAKQSNDERPFRMMKVNLLWEKAQKRLGPEKLKNLYDDLKIQDKDEITYKHFKATGGDKDGLKEAQLRRHFQAIMNKYDLLEHLESVEEALKYSRGEQHKSFNEVNDEFAKGLFKDRKLNKLWKKAERSGFSDEELQTLKEELHHHQEKLNEYHSLMDEVSKEYDRDDQLKNSLDRFQSEEVRAESKNYKAASQALKEKHEALKASYERISKMSIPDGGFEEVKVQELWKLALQSNFTKDELQSLKEELQHYEHRIKKLKHLQSQTDFHGIHQDKFPDKDKPDDQKHLEQRVKQYEHKVNKVYADIHSRILQKHSEL